MAKNFGCDTGKQCDIVELDLPVEWHHFTLCDERYHEILSTSDNHA